MKYYKIKLPHRVGLGYQYPPNYTNSIGIFNQGHIYYQDEIDDIFTLLIAIPDQNVLLDVPANIFEVSEQEAIDIGKKYDPSIEVITNDAVVQRLAIKAQLGQSLTATELKALDPRDSEPGFGMSDNFERIIQKKKARGI